MNDGKQYNRKLFSSRECCCMIYHIVPQHGVHGPSNKLSNQPPPRHAMPEKKELAGANEKERAHEVEPVPAVRSNRAGGHEIR
jgi:hypothetical protein